MKMGNSVRLWSESLFLLFKLDDFGDEEGESCGSWLSSENGDRGPYEVGEMRESRAAKLTDFFPLRCAGGGPGGGLISSSDGTLMASTSAGRVGLDLGEEGGDSTCC
jgi:hypothetical protein